MTEHPKIELTIMAVQEVLQHSQYNLIPLNEITLKKKRCGDGRDTSDTAEAVFGADIGYMAATAAAYNDLHKDSPTRISSSEIVHTVGDILAGEEGITYVHTDDRAEPTEVAGGCGFNRQVKINPQFGLTPDDIQAIDTYLQKKKSKKLLEQAVYAGSHTEGAVGLVRSNRYSIRAYDTQRDTSIFVVQLTLIDQRIHQLATTFTQKYGGDAADMEAKIKEKLEAQMALTKEAIAKEKPMYSIEVSDEGAINVLPL